MGQRSRKRGQRQKPPTSAVTLGATGAASRSDTRRRVRAEERDAALRAGLAPIAPGERPWPITVGALLAALNGLVQLILFLAGVKFKLGGARPAAFSVILFAVLMFVCAAGMWRMRYWAVLGFQALLGIVILTFALLLIRASTVTGAAISIVVVVAGGFLFFKMVRVLSRIQMPKYPGR
ncbi:MAG TPA: hypothetical protein VE983_01260 [Solirubrobacteraceae bacterium]|nr:hypothetical protein [Solirubrobacteraceae bacterium]